MIIFLRDIGCLYKLNCAMVVFAVDRFFQCAGAITGFLQRDLKCVDDNIIPHNDAAARGEEHGLPRTVNEGIFLNQHIFKDRFSASAVRKIDTHIEHGHLPGIQVAVADDIISDNQTVYAVAFTPTGFTAGFNLNCCALYIFKHIIFQQPAGAL